MFKRIFYIIKQRLYVNKNKNKPCQGKVYMFHKVDDSNDTYSITKENFKEFLSWLKNNKKIVDVNTLINNIDSNNVVITFDDAYKSVYENAYPILKELEIPYVIFECIEYLNEDNYLNEDMLKEMLTNSKCLIGSHSLKHELFRFKDKNAVINDLNESKKLLEERFNIKIDSFAFPYGSMYACSDTNIERAKSIYKNVFMTYSLSYNSDYLNVIPRINMNDKVYKEEMK